LIASILASPRKRKEHLRTIGMGGIGKEKELESPLLIIAHSFLHVPMPNALRYSFSSSSQLTL